MSATRGDRRWMVLAIIGIAQLMVVLDATIVNIALPSAQAALHFSTELRQWVITAYALAFGSLLLVGGRVGDLCGRKWTFVGGAIGFAVASAVGGAAPSFAWLVGARAAQGVFGAMLAPSALGLLTTTFTDKAERNKAFAVFSAIAGSGVALGLLLGGVLTQLLSWRFGLFINLAIAIPAAAGGVWLLPHERPGTRTSFDWLGAAAGCGGLFCLVYGFSSAEMHTWTATLTIASLAAAAALLTAFVAIESRVRHPLLPLRVVADRARGGSYLGIAVVGVGLLGSFLFLTYFLQRTLGDSPIMTGVAFLPLAGSLALSAAATNLRLRDRFGPRPLISFGALLGAGGLAWLAQLTPTSSYATDVLGPIIVIGVGIGLVMGSSIFTATSNVDPLDAGVASAMVNTMQQVSGAVGTALLSTIFASAMRADARGNPSSPHVLGVAAVHGYTVAFWISAGIFAGGAIVLAVILPSNRPATLPPPRDVVAPDVHTDNACQARRATPSRSRSGRDDARWILTAQHASGRNAHRAIGAESHQRTTTERRNHGTFLIAGATGPRADPATSLTRPGDVTLARVADSTLLCLWRASTAARPPRSASSTPLKQSSPPVRDRWAGARRHGTPLRERPVSDCGFGQASEGTVSGPPRDPGQYASTPTAVRERRAAVRRGS